MTGKSAWGAAKHLSLLVRSKLAGDSDVTAALEDLQSGPPDEARIRVVAEVLRGHAKRDKGFRAELEALVAAVEQA